VVEQQLKKCCGGKLVLGWFFGLGFILSIGCVWKSLGTWGEVRVSEKVLIFFLRFWVLDCASEGEL